MFAQKMSFGVVGFVRGAFTVPDGGGRTTLGAVAPPPTRGANEGVGATVAVCGGGAVGWRGSGVAIGFALSAGADAAPAAPLRSGTMY